MKVTPHQQSPLALLVGLLSAAVGWSVSEYCGPAGWVPFGSALILFFLFAKTKFKPRLFMGAIIFTLAHLIWLASAIFITGEWSSVLVDLIVFSICTMLLWLRPNGFTATLLGIIQIVSLGLNCHVMITQFEVGDPMHRALTVHVLLRILALTGLVVGYLNYRRKPTEMPATAEQPQAVS